MFDPKPHLIQLPRKVKDRHTGQYTTVYDDYLEVKWRLVWFREKFPQGAIETQEIVVDVAQGYARFVARVETGEGGKATGYGTETAAGCADYVERAETRALGRALAALGIGTQFVGQDLTEGEHVADAPVATVNGQAVMPVTASAAEVLADRPAVSPPATGDPRPRTIPLDVGLPCGGLAIEALNPGQLAMLLSKVASLVHAEGDRWVPLLAALQREKATRLEPGRTAPVQAPVPTGDVPDPEPPAREAEAPQEEGTAEAETTEPDRETAERQRWGALSRRSMRAGLSAMVWERLRQGDYPSAARVIVALELASTPGAG